MCWRLECCRLSETSPLCAVHFLFRGSLPSHRGILNTSFSGNPSHRAILPTFFPLSCGHQTSNLRRTTLGLEALPLRSSAFFTLSVLSVLLQNAHEASLSVRSRLALLSPTAAVLTKCSSKPFPAALFPAALFPAGVSSKPGGETLQCCKVSLASLWRDTSVLQCCSL